MRRMDSIMEVSSPSCLLHTRAHLHFGGGQIAYSKFHQEKCNHLSSKGSRRQIDRTMRCGAKDDNAGIFIGKQIRLSCIYFFITQNQKVKKQGKKTFQKIYIVLRQEKLEVNFFFYQKIIGRLYKMTCYSLLTLKLIDLESIWKFAETRLNSFFRRTRISGSRSVRKVLSCQDSTSFILSLRMIFKM